MVRGWEVRSPSKSFGVSLLTPALSLFRVAWAFAGLGRGGRGGGECHQAGVH